MQANQQPFLKTDCNPCTPYRVASHILCVSSHLISSRKADAQSSSRGPSGPEGADLRPLRRAVVHTFNFKTVRPLQDWASRSSQEGDSAHLWTDMTIRSTVHGVAIATVLVLGCLLLLHHFAPPGSPATQVLVPRAQLYQASFYVQTTWRSVCRLFVQLLADMDHRVFGPCGAWLTTVLLSPMNKVGPTVLLPWCCETQWRGLPHVLCRVCRP